MDTRPQRPEKKAVKPQASPEAQQPAVPQFLKTRQEVMIFYNDYLRGVKAGDPLLYLNDLQKAWVKEIQETYQPTARIFEVKDYADQIKTEFNRMGYSPAGYFGEHNTSGLRKPETLLTNDEFEELRKMGLTTVSDYEFIKEHRQFTKYRVITSDMPFLDADCETLIRRKVITACGINLMNSSPHDEAKYLIKTPEGNLINEAEFQHTCYVLALFIVQVAKLIGMKNLSVAEFSLGVYLNAVRPDQKDVARNCMYRAFDLAAEIYGLDVEWLLFDDTVLNPVPDKFDADGNKIKTPAERAAEERPKKFHCDNLKFRKGNILEEENSLNNGSCATIAGRFLHYNPGTTEEQLFQACFGLLIQTVLNSWLGKQVERLDINVNDALRAKKALFENKHGCQIKLGQRKKDRLIQYAFKTQEKAIAFAKLLKEKYGITNHKDSTKPINVYEEGARQPITDTPSQNPNGTHLVRLNGTHTNLVLGQGIAHLLLVDEFVQKYQLDFSGNPEHCRHWETSFGGEAVTLKNGSTIKVSPAVAFIYKTLNDGKLTLAKQLTEIAEKTPKASPAPTLFGGGAAINELIDAAAALRTDILTAKDKPAPVMATQPTRKMGVKG